MIKRPTIKILTYLLDDDKDFIDLIDAHFKVRNVKDYLLFTDATKFLNEVTSDVSVCVFDYNLEGIKGSEIIKQVKKTNPNCFFIIISGYMNEHEMKKSVNAGANRIATKDEPEFLDRLIEYIEEGIEAVRERFDFYSQVWERFLETEKIFAKIINDEPGNLEDINN